MITAPLSLCSFQTHLADPHVIPNTHKVHKDSIFRCMHSHFDFLNVAVKSFLLSTLAVVYDICIAVRKHIM